MMTHTLTELDLICWLLKGLMMLMMKREKESGTKKAKKKKNARAENRTPVIYLRSRDPTTEWLGQTVKLSERRISLISLGWEYLNRADDICGMRGENNQQIQKFACWQIFDALLMRCIFALLFLLIPSSFTTTSLSFHFVVVDSINKSLSKRNIIINQQPVCWNLIMNKKGQLIMMMINE